MKAWQPDYQAEFVKRIKNIDYLMKNPSEWEGIKLFYAENPINWINDWCVTYNPRNETPLPKTMPFILFSRQEDFVYFLLDCLKNKQSGLIEKSRDMGATWLCAAFSVWLWLFKPESATGWGSRKELLVDRLGDPDSIFQKMRMIIGALPGFMQPKGFDVAKHGTYMKIVNPENGSTITGEAGDNIGRGGRKLIYFKDESAHYEHPELIEAALGDNTNVQIDISSVNGSGNIFYTRRQGGEIWTPEATIPTGKTRVFIMDWRDHPLKTEEWYNERRAKAESDGLLHLFAQEVDRDYTSALDRIIIPQKWIKAAIDAHVKLNLKIDGLKYAGLDVADEGGDKNAIAIRHGILLQHLDSWAEGDAGETARRAFNLAQQNSVNQLYYDCIGVGAAVKSEANRMVGAGALPRNISIVPWNAAESPINATGRLITGDMKSPLIGDFFANLKSQGWWSVRQRFEKTYKMVTQNIIYKADELISLPSTLPRLHELCAELSQPQHKVNGVGKLLVDKKPDGTRSPNLADALIMCYHPVKTLTSFDVL